MRASIIALILASGLLAQTSNRSLLLRPDAPEFSQPAPARCTVRLDTSKGVVIGTLEGFEQPVISLAFDANGERLACVPSGGLLDT